MLIGIDACKNPDRVFHAYNDKRDFTHEFILNGLSHANRILGQTNAFKPGEWEVIGQYNEEVGCHQAFVSPLLDVVVDNISIPRGEKIRIEESYKYSASETEQLWESTGLVEGSRWTNKKGDYGKLSFFSWFFFFPSPLRLSHPLNRNISLYLGSFLSDVSFTSVLNWTFDNIFSRTTSGVQTTGVFSSLSRGIRE